VYEPNISTKALGGGTAAGGGKPSTSHGHLFAFGNTEELLLWQNRGCPGVGSPDAAGGAYDHSTGAGWVAAHRGLYAGAADAGHECTFLFAETSGALAPGFVRFLRDLADSATAVNCVDRTVYGEARTATTSFFTHHLRRVSSAIVLTGAGLLNAAATAVASNVAGSDATDAAVLRPRARRRYTRGDRGCRAT